MVAAPRQGRSSETHGAHATQVRDIQLATASDRHDDRVNRTGGEAGRSRAGFVRGRSVGLLGSTGRRFRGWRWFGWVLAVGYGLYRSCGKRGEVEGWIVVIDVPLVYPSGDCAECREVFECGHGVPVACHVVGWIADSLEAAL